MKIGLSEVEKWVDVGRSKIYKDARKGILSNTKDPQRGNRKVVDVAELQRVYRKIQNPQKNPQRTWMDRHSNNNPKLYNASKMRYKT